MFQKLKAAFQNYLERMEKENKELLGGQRADCCSLNRRRTPQSGGAQTSGQDKGKGGIG